MSPLTSMEKWPPGSYTLLVIAVFTWLLGVVIYRMYFHPLASIPGPFLASITEGYRFYYNYIRLGKLYLEFDRLHDTYGPLIRISPNEVLLADPENFDKIYSMNSKLYKDPAFYSYAGADNSLVAIISNEEHRRKRAILNPFFSRRAVLEQEDIIQRKVAKVCRRIEEDANNGCPTNLHRGFRGIAVDVVTEYAFGADNCFNCLDDYGLGLWFNEAMAGMAPMLSFFLFLPWLKAPMQLVPDWLTQRMNPLMAPFLSTLKTARRLVQNVMSDVERGIKPKRATIFHTLLDPRSTSGGKTPSEQHLVEEGWSLTGAAAETAGGAMTIGAYHVVSNPKIYNKLREELVATFPDPNAPMDYLTLEKVPYLTGVVKEALRLGYGPLNPLPRVVPAGGATFNGNYFSEGTVVSMSSWFMHREPSAFPHPDRFDPERWLDPEKARYQDRFMVPFSRGHRQCIGQSLAICELYVSLGQIFRKFDDLKPFDFGPEDMVFDGLFTAWHRKGARTFKVMRASAPKE